MFLQDEEPYNPSFIEEESGAQTGYITAANQIAAKMCSNREAMFLNSYLLSVCGQQEKELYSSKNEFSGRCLALINNIF